MNSKERIQKANQELANSPLFQALLVTAKQIEERQANEARLEREVPRDIDYNCETEPF